MRIDVPFPRLFSGSAARRAWIDHDAQLFVVRPPSLDIGARAIRRAGLAWTAVFTVMVACGSATQRHP
jgi:hypothetical protein